MKVEMKSEISKELKFSTDETVDFLESFFDIGNVNRCSGRTTALAKAFVRIAERNQGKEIYPIDHFIARPNSVAHPGRHVIMDVIDKILQEPFKMPFVGKYSYKYTYDLKRDSFKITGITRVD